MKDDELTAEDEIWLSHMKDRDGKWLVLVGDYPHLLGGAGNTLAEAIADAERNGYTDNSDMMLFKVPNGYPIVTTPFLNV